MTNLSVNINKIATLRNARGGNNPDVVRAAIDIQRFGADGITVHPRPDERHIRRSDVFELKKVVTTEFNIEGYPSKEFIDMVLSVKPNQVTLVPDPPHALTSNAGWNTIQKANFLKEVLREFKDAGIRTSLFVDTNVAMIYKAAEIGADRVELYTEPYAQQYSIDCEKAIKSFIKAANAARESGVGLNAGHDLSLENLRYFAQNIPGLLEVSIGHALVCDALYFGLENTVQMYLERLRF